MKLIKTEPWNGFPALFTDDLGRFMRNRISRFFPDLDEEEGLLVKWAPALDIQEQDDHYLVRADLPGVDPKDVEITLENGVMTIRGKREETTEEEKEGYSRRERFSGEFFRRFALPDSAEPEKVTATSKKGVVEITIPKVKVTKAKKIKIKSTE